MLVGQVANAGMPIMAFVIGGASLVAVLLLLVFFLTLLFRHLSSARQLTHTERMRTLEAGFSLEPAEDFKAHAKYQHNAFWISFWLVFGVPAAALSAASTATSKVAGNPMLTTIIWTGGALTSIAAVIGATLLMMSTRSRASDEPEAIKSLKKLV